MPPFSRRWLRDCLIELQLHYQHPKAMMQMVGLTQRTPPTVVGVLQRCLELLEEVRMDGQMSHKMTYNDGWDVPGSTPSTSFPSRDDTQQPTSSQGHDDAHNHTTVAVPPAEQIPTTTAAPSAPPIIDEAFADVGIHYLQVDSSPLDLGLTATDSKHGTPQQNKNYNARGTCVVCLDASVEVACIPCGHMAGCMPCLNEIKKKEWGCPVCRANIDQVIKLYFV